MKKGLLLVVAVLFTVFSFAQNAADKIKQANEALSLKDYEKAYKLYDEALKNMGTTPVDPSMYYYVGFSAYKSKNNDAALTYFDKAIKNGTNVSKCHEYKALIYNENKDYENTVASYEKAIATSKEKPNAIVYNAAMAAYRGEMNEKAIEFFSKSVANGYKGETAIYYKAAIFKKDSMEVEYKATLEEGAAKYPTDEKICKALASLYVNEGNALYTKGAAILNAANQQVNDKKMKTSDPAYTAEVDKAKVEFKAAVVVLDKAKILDPTNKNAQTLLDACNGVL